MMRVLPVNEMVELIGREVAVSEWLEIDQERIDRFAECTGDFQWIHVDAEKAAAGPFGRTIAHGFLVLSLIPYFSTSDGVVPEGRKMTVNYGLNKVRFIHPVAVGSQIRNRSILSGVDNRPGNRLLVTTTHQIEIRGVEKPACVAETLAMFFL